MDRCDGSYAAGSTTSAKHSGSIAPHTSLGQLPHHAGQVEEPQCSAISPSSLKRKMCATFRLVICVFCSRCMIRAYTHLGK